MSHAASDLEGLPAPGPTARYASRPAVVRPDARSRPHHPPKAVLLDMDGTLVATEPVWSQVVGTVARAHGAPWDPSADDGLLVGVLVPDLVELLQGRGVAMSTGDLTALLLREVADRIGTSPPWRPGALTLLRALAEHGVPTALVTTSVRRHADAIGAGAPAGALTVVVTFEDVARHKPDPAAYLLAMDRLGVAPSDAVALEDSVPGVRAALAAGVTTFAVQPATTFPDEVAGHPRLRRFDGLDAARAALGLLHGADTPDEADGVGGGPAGIDPVPDGPPLLRSPSAAEVRPSSPR